MNVSPMALRKMIVGLISIGCLITAVVAALFGNWTSPVVSVCARMGVMLAALWWALPNQGENIAWEKGFPIVLAVIVVLSFLKRGGGRALLYVVPIAIVVAVVAVVIRPKPKRRR